MIVEVEVGIIDHGRMLQSERDLDHPLPEGRNQGQAVGDEVPDGPEVQAPLHPVGVEDQGAQYLEMGGG